MNLSIRKFIVLPEIYASLGTLFPEHLSLYRGHIMFGFGFDSGNKDFKVVVLVPGWYKNPLIAPVEVYVYSLASGQWRSIKDGVPSIFSCSHLSSKRSLTFVNGALHWVFCGKCNNQRRPSFISTFDLAEETFGETMLPNCWDDESCFHPSLLVRGSCLALAYRKKDSEGSDVMYIWVMKEYGAVDSWNLVRCVNLRHYPRIQRIIALRSSEEMVVKVIGGMLFLLDNDLEKPKAAKDLELRQYEVGFAADHVESLFLIKQKYKSYVKDFVDVRFVSPK
ncbi:F-box protein CPR1-like [Neltuma alba]|uniref:F-box protein CPR1-like n=1 Tax=Neltuma alba TaxID=207710 RepID=UPI0010A58575|nr:F-box protein CPR1-like [Prosopis alba]